MLFWQEIWLWKYFSCFPHTVTVPGRLICSERIQVAFFFLLFKRSSEVVSQTHLNIIILNERQISKMYVFLPSSVGTRWVCKGTSHPSSAMLRRRADLTISHYIQSLYQIGLTSFLFGWFWPQSDSLEMAIQVRNVSFLFEPSERSFQQFSRSDKRMTVVSVLPPQHQRCIHTTYISQTAQPKIRQVH